MTRSTRFTSIRLPMPVAKRIDEQLAHDGTYTSRAEWVKAVVVRRLEELEK